MTKKVKQFRYYGENHPKNSPNNMTAEQLIQGTPFAGKSIIQLGIQALPGTKFYVNGDSVNAIMLGSTGIFELDLPLGFEINDLRFNSNSLDKIANSYGLGLIVDIVYESEEAVE